MPESWAWDAFFIVVELNSLQGNDAPVWGRPPENSAVGTFSDFL